MPAPRAVSMANIRNSGRNRIDHEGAKWYHIINPTKIINEIRKSTKLTITVLTGIINLGKYIFVSIFELVSNELLASVKEVAKNCQGNIPAYTKIG